jgi:hypothetical protein
MILPDICIPEFINLSVGEFGLDTLQECKDKIWFENFPHTVSYDYNSRGFRDHEWPEDLKNAVWCIGDSFTVGVGSIFQHTWPNLLAKEIPQRVINVSLNGASNDFISRMSKIIKAEVDPFAIIHQWSYIHRRELSKNVQVWYDNSDPLEDVENFIQNIKSTNDKNNIHSLIPFFEPEENFARIRLRKEKISNVIYDNRQLDFARDYHHYDIITARKYINYYKEILGTLNYNWQN